MKRFLTIVFVIILLSSSLGCLKNPTPPGSDRPRLVIDLGEGENGTDETIVYLQSIEPARFDKIRLKVNGTEMRNKTDSFTLEHRISKPHFELNIDVKKEDKSYNFNATFVLKPRKGIVYKVIYYDGEVRDLEDDELPFLAPLNLKEESNA